MRLRINILLVVIGVFLAIISAQNSHAVGKEEQVIVSVPGASHIELKAIKAYKQTKSVNFFNYLAIDTNINSQQVQSYRQIFYDFVEELKKAQKDYDSELAFVKHIRKQVHKKFLINYAAYQTFSNIFTQKQYDCLTGSIFFAEIFENTGIAYNFQVAPHHVYLKVFPDDQAIILETTDPAWGIKDEKDDIQAFKNKYRNEMSDNYEKILKASGYYTDGQDFHVIKDGRKSTMCAYLYYNFAINAFNRKDFKSTIEILERGLAYDDAPRMIGLLLIAIQYQLKDDNLEPEERITYSKKLKTYRNYKISAYALK